MKVNFNIEIEDLDGQPLPRHKTGEGGKVKETGENVTLKSLCIDALYLTYREEGNLSGEDKVKRHILAERIYKAKGAIELSAKEIVLLKELIGKAYGPLAVARSYELLEK